MSSPFEQDTLRQSQCASGWGLEASERCTCIHAGLARRHALYAPAVHFPILPCSPNETYMISCLISDEYIELLTDTAVCRLQAAVHMSKNM